MCLRWPLCLAQPCVSVVTPLLLGVHSYGGALLGSIVCYG